MCRWARRSCSISTAPRRTDFGSPRIPAERSRAPTASTPSGAPAPRRRGSPAECRAAAAPGSSCPRAPWRGSMRRLSPDEAKLWARVVESVRPLDGVALPGIPAAARTQEAPVQPDPGLRRGAAPPPPTPPPRKTPGETLDGSWDRRLGRGLVSPDAVLDLHGHNLATAYDLLDRRLEEAIRSGARLLLLVTGEPPGPERPTKRGAIRAAVGDWLHASRHAGDIAAVRNAHPRHGGTGALYIVLRRQRG